MKRHVLGLGLLAACALTVAAAEDEKKTPLPDPPPCPVSGEPIDFSFSTNTDMGPMYFCCNRCIGKFKENPSKFASASAEQRAALAKRPKVQVTCPISGKPVDAEAFAMVDGKKIFACCDKCVKKIAADPQKYKGKLAAAYTYQTRCPVTGQPIDPAVFTTVGDEKVYFCCKMCPKQFESDPAKFAPNLELQGFGKLASAAVQNKG